MPSVRPYSSETVSIHLILTDESRAEVRRAAPFELLAQMSGLDPRSLASGTRRNWQRTNLVAAAGKGEIASVSRERRFKQISLKFPYSSAARVEVSVVSG